MKSKYKNVVIAGDIGTGTSTLAQGLADKLDWKYLSAGDYFRSYHKAHNIPLWNKAALPDEIERKTDQEFFEKMKEEQNIVFDGHYSGWLAKDLDLILKILLVAKKNVATQRILDRQHTHVETTEEIEKRRGQLKQKFRKLYSNDDYEDSAIFDLVIDTTTTGKNETLQIAYTALKKGY